MAWQTVRRVVSVSVDFNFGRPASVSIRRIDDEARRPPTWLAPFFSPLRFMKTAIIRIANSSRGRADSLLSQVEIDLFREAVLLDLGISAAGCFTIDSNLLFDGWLEEMPEGITAGLISGDFEAWYQSSVAMISEHPVRISYQLDPDGQVDHWSRLNDDEAVQVSHTIELSSDFMRGVFTEIRSPLPAEPIKLDDYQAVIEVVEMEPGTIWGSPDFRDALDAHHRALRVEQMNATIAHASGTSTAQPPAQLATHRRSGAGL